MAITLSRDNSSDARLARSLPLERKLPLLIFGVLAGVLALSLGVSYYEIRRSAEHSAADRLTGLSHVLASMALQPVSSRLTLMRRVARDSSILEALAAPSNPLSPAARAELGMLVATRMDSAMPAQLWTRDGEVVGGLGLELSPERRHARDEIVGSRSDSAVTSHLYVAGGSASIWIALPVRHEGELLGFVAQERRINGNPRTLQPLRDLIGSDIEFYFRNTDDPTWVKLTGQSAPPPIRTRRALDSLAIYTYANGGRMLAASASVSGTPLLVTVEQPLDDILGRPLAVTRALAVISLILAVIGAAAAWFISRRVAKPLVELTSAAEGMAHGEYSERVHVTGTDEVGRLAAAFNRMAEQVEEASNASAQAVHNLTQSVERQEFLSNASRILADSLSDESMLTELARACVPRLADYCAIHLREDDGRIRRIETVHRDAAKQEMTRRLGAHYDFRSDGPGAIPEIMRAQRPMLLPHVDYAATVRAAPDSEAARLLEQFRPRSYIGVPLVARGRVFGVISLMITDSDRAFSDDDLSVAMELARRTAIAIDNAILYRHSIALRMEAEAASNAKSDFLAKMSHEIRTPINAMVGYAELMQLGIAGEVSEVQAKHLERIRVSGAHLTSLVNEILDLARIEAGSLVVQPVVANCIEAVESALALVRPQATSKGVELMAQIGGNATAEYYGDPKRVQQIVLNLLSNAVKFTPAGGRVWVECGVGTRPGATLANAAADWVCISVHDTGVGIADDDRDRIFHPFVQVDAGYTRAHGGTGLGLAISRNLAQMMGGEITVESVLGAGSQFALWLPCPIRALVSA